MFSLCALPFNSTFVPNKTLLEQLNIEELQAMTIVITQLYTDSMGVAPESSCIKPYFRHLWKFFVFMYSTVGLLGAAGNIYMIAVMTAETNFRRFVNYLLLNLSLCDVFKCLVVLPISMCVLLLKHWYFGVTMCYLLPVLQTFPVIVSMVTYFLIALNRYFLVFHSSSKTLSKRIYIFLMAAVWVSSACLAIPLKAYMRYFDLGDYLGETVRGQGLCVVRFSTDIREMNSALFIALFVIPIVSMAYLFVKTNTELKRQLNTPTKTNNNDEQNSRDEYQYLKVTPSHSVEPQSHQQIGNSSSSGPFHVEPTATSARSNSFLCYIDQEKMQISLLIKFNQCLATMITIFALCWAPLQCLMLVTYVIAEAKETLATVDTFFVFFTLIGFLSSISNPALLLYQKKILHTTVQTGIRILRRFSSTSENRKRSTANRPPSFNDDD